MDAVGFGPRVRSVMSSRPLISIVICSYNRAHLLRPTLQSVLQQSYAPVEILFLDDGSSDDTRQVVQSCGERIRYVHQDNAGIAAARSRACQLAQGEYIAFQDDDDLMPADRLSVLYEALCRRADAVFAVGDFAVIDAQGEPTGDRWLPTDSHREGEVVIFDKDAYQAVMWPRVPAAPHTTLFRRQTALAIGGFDPAYRYAAEDKDFFARLALRGPVVYVHHVVSWYRRGHGSLTNSDERTSRGALRLYASHLERFCPPDASMRRRLRQRIYLTLRQLARGGAGYELFSWRRRADPQLEFARFLPPLARLRLHLVYALGKLRRAWR